MTQLFIYLVSSFLIGWLIGCHVQHKQLRLFSVHGVALSFGLIFYWAIFKSVVLYALYQHARIVQMVAVLALAVALGILLAVAVLAAVVSYLERPKKPKRPLASGGTVWAGESLDTLVPVGSVQNVTFSYDPVTMKKLRDELAKVMEFGITRAKKPKRKNTEKLVLWARGGKSCRHCRSTKRPHHGKGYCRTCYHRSYKGKL